MVHAVGSENVVIATELAVGDDCIGYSKVSFAVLPPRCRKRKLTGTVVTGAIVVVVAAPVLMIFPTPAQKPFKDCTIG